MGNIIMISLVWITAFACYPIMKKIQPGTEKLYLIYSIFICVLVTVFAAVYLGWV